MKHALFNKYRFRSSAAFSLLEIIAVLAILAILAAALLPAVIKQADAAAQNTEATNLVTFANAFQQGALRQRYLPDANTWYAFIATNTGWQTNSVVTNSRNNPRVFLIDPNLTLGALTAANLPYLQDSNTTTLPASPPTNVRFMIVSSMAQNSLPSGMTNGLNSTVDFNNLWATPDNTIPPNTADWDWSNFKQGSDVQIQRINFTGMFCHLILNVATNEFADWSIGPAVIVQHTGGGGVDGYVLKNTPVGLFLTNGLSVECEQILLQDSCYTFQCGIWRVAPPISRLNIVNVFTNQPAPGLGTVTPASVCSDMINFMASYSAYANSGYNVAFKPNVKAYQVTLSNDVNALSQ